MGSIATAPLRALYDALSIPSRPAPADIIFVYAGMQERKRFGLELWRQGLAPSLVLSVGRFEWRRALAMDLPSTGRLRELVDATPPVERHFFLTLERGGGVRAERTRPGHFGTHAESKALAAVARERGYRSILVVSSAPHLRRVAVSLRRAVGPDIALAFVSVPEADSSVRRGEWWRHRIGWSVVAAECVKLPLYALLARW